MMDIHKFSAKKEYNNDEENDRDSDPAAKEQRRTGTHCNSSVVSNKSEGLHYRVIQTYWYTLQGSGDTLNCIHMI